MSEIFAQLDNPSLLDLYESVDEVSHEVGDTPEHSEVKERGRSMSHSSAAGEPLQIVDKFCVLFLDFEFVFCGNVLKNYRMYSSDIY